MGGGRKVGEGEMAVSANIVLNSRNSGDKYVSKWNKIYVPDGDGDRYGIQMQTWSGVVYFLFLGPGM